MQKCNFSNLLIIGEKNEKIKVISYILSSAVNIADKNMYKIIFRIKYGKTDFHFLKFFIKDIDGMMKVIKRPSLIVLSTY